jgi:hypothetical protein
MIMNIVVKAAMRAGSSVMGCTFVGFGERFKGHAAANPLRGFEHKLS